MNLGEFITKFSHNNIIRLLYKTEEGHEVVANNWNDVGMDWEVTKQRGKFRHFVANKVLGLATISFRKDDNVHYKEALNIVIERLDNQPYLEDSSKPEYIYHAE